jgi:putative FmdB family regulatory protein
MPTYEYICEKCGHEFETIRSIAAPPLKICPANLCARKTWGRGKVKKKISAGTGLLFKGSGFYITDYRSEGYKQSAKKDSGATQTPAPAPAKTEAKAAPANAEKK